MRKAALSHAVFAVLPLLVMLDVMHYTYHSGHIQAFDFHYEYWPAAQHVLHGMSPYAHRWMNIPGSIAFPYPAFTALAFIPLALLNHALADWVYTGVNIAAAMLALRVMDVRDWRLYGLVLIWWPVVISWQVANVTLVLCLGIACLWRKRDNPLLAGALVTVMISLKPFAWPLGLWLLATRRYRAGAYALACGLVLNAVSWAIVGFNQLHAYGQVVAAVNHVMDRQGYSVVSLVMHLGGGRVIAYALAMAAAAAVALGCLLAGRRGDARSALALCVALCLLATPVLWSHYFALLIVPFALFRPRLDRLWLLPLVMWACPAGGPATWQIAIGLIATAIAFGMLLRRPQSSVPASAGRTSPGLVPGLAGLPSHS